MSALRAAQATSDAATLDTLLHRARQGDLSAWADLVYRYQEPAYRMAYLIVRSTSDAHDVTRDALVRAYRALPSLTRDQPFLPWLLRIVAGEARHRRREVGRESYGVRRDRGSALPAFAVGSAAGGTGFGTASGTGFGTASGTGFGGPRSAHGVTAHRGGVSAVEAGGWPGYQQALSVAIDRLAEEDRLLIFCRHLLGMPDADAAQVLGVGADSIDERASAALSRLRARMGLAANS